MNFSLHVTQKHPFGEEICKHDGQVINEFDTTLDLAPTESALNVTEKQAKALVEESCCSICGLKLETIVTLNN